MFDNENNEIVDSVAIIGMAGRFPGAKTVDALWKNLCDGLESITFFSNDELNQNLDSALKDNPHYVKARGVIEAPDEFDNAFFGMSPREAQVMDPQQRIFLEVAWGALENAGYDPDRYNGLIGVFGGTGFNSYYTHHVTRRPDIIEIFGEHQVNIANGPDYLASRVSYKFNLRGPSISLYTGCSLSLVAVCHAFDSLMGYQCDVALAGASFIQCPLNCGYLYRDGEIHSADGHCRPFDEQAQGTVFSDGVGIVVLKRFEDALNDGDYIYATIKGSALNNDGSDKVSFTAPSVRGQAEVIAMAQANAEIHPETLSYIETHGTGTKLGDPIEFEALSQAFRAKTSKRCFCAIGSIKANIGHLDAAAGVAGLIKTALILHHKLIPPSINYSKPNPNINFQNSPFYVNTELLELKSGEHPLRAGVSSFGVGGTNSHVIIEQFSPVTALSPSRDWQLILLSARTNAALDKATTNLANHLKQHRQLNLADVAYTLQTGRKFFEHRRMAVCRNISDAVKSLEVRNSKWVKSSVKNSARRVVVFMFSGQGSQYENMGLGLYQKEAVFREAIDYCAQILQPDLSLDLRSILYPGEDLSDKAVQILNRTYIAQPALFAFEYALAKLWMSWGIQPQAMVGHSIGEYVAACLAGVFTLEDALSLVATRGRLMQDLPTGAMLAVPLPETDIRSLLGNRLSLAAVNTPNLCVISGKKETVDDIEKHLTDKAVHTTRLHTSHAFHSKMIEPIMKEFTDRVKTIERRVPTIPYVSNFSGTWIRAEEATSPEYWAQHMRQTVQFSSCLDTLFQEPNRIFLEVGPGHTLSLLARQHPTKEMSHLAFSSSRHPKENDEDLAFILNTLGELWLTGIEIDWSKFYASENRRRLPLPTYPFERKLHWINAAKRDDLPPYDLSEPKQEFILYPDISSIPVEQHIERQIENKTERAVTDIFRKILGVEEIGTDDNFFRLGGSSLMAVGLFAQIEKIFDKKLPLATLYEAPTVGQLAEIIDDQNWKAPWANLVEIQAGGSKPPLFLVHGAGGNVLIYRELSFHLGADQPVYGLQSRGLDGESSPHECIEDMAVDYIEEVKKIYPTGPYMLGGYCMGGTVAFEMAQQLHKIGEEVVLVALFETYNFSNTKPQSFIDNIYYYIQKIDFHWRNFLLLTHRSKWQFLKAKAKVAKRRKQAWLGMVTSNFGFQFIKTNRQTALLANVLAINDQASLNYVPMTYPGRITQFLPKKEYAHHLGPEMGWNGLAMRGVETNVLRVYPAGMLVEPFVQMTAEKLKCSIKKALISR